MPRHSGSHSATTGIEAGSVAVGAWASVEDVVAEPAGGHLGHHMQGVADSEGVIEEAREEENLQILNIG